MNLPAIKSPIAATRVFDPVLLVQSMFEKVLVLTKVSAEVLLVDVRVEWDNEVFSLLFPSMKESTISR